MYNWKHRPLPAAPSRSSGSFPEYPGRRHVWRHAGPLLSLPARGRIRNRALPCRLFDPRWWDPAKSPACPCLRNPPELRHHAIRTCSELPRLIGRPPTPMAHSYREFNIFRGSSTPSEVAEKVSRGSETCATWACESLIGSCGAGPRPANVTCWTSFFSNLPQTCGTSEKLLLLIRRLFTRLV